MTLPAIVNTARTLSYYNTLQDVTANNLANVNSDAFKGDRITAVASTGDMHPVASESTDLRQGDLRDTGRPLDVALQGPGFMVVSTPAGERLTRSGSLVAGPGGILSDKRGNAVLGTDGPINVTGNKVVINPDGTIVVDGTTVGQLRLETVPNLQAMTRQGEGLFVPNQKTIAVAPDDIGVHQGAIEDSNVNPLSGSVDMIMIQRAYASSVEALRTMDSVLGTVTGDIAKI
ncbi:MAG TPA: flagellar hook basal-body protein [Gemmatimonadales bacterium]|jgi:flagellar basal body rod protein FlgG